MTYEIIIEGKSYRLELSRTSPAANNDIDKKNPASKDKTESGWQCSLDGRHIPIDAVLTDPDVLSLIINGKVYEVKRERSATDTHLWVGSARYAAEIRDPRSLRSRQASGAGEGPVKLVAPMPGKVVRLLVQEKAEVEAGQGLLVVEAMKMQNEIKSPKKGVVQKIATAAGASVNAGDLLAIVE